MQKKTLKDLVAQTTDIFEVFKDENGWLRLQLIQGKMFVHYENFRFSPSIYKKTIDQFIDVCEALKASGVDEVYTCVPNEQKVIKFQEMFGFNVEAENGSIVLFRKDV